MKYTISQTKEAKLSGMTRMAITLFEKLAKTENKVDQLTEALNAQVFFIPEVEMEAYIEITNEISKKNSL